MKLEKECPTCGSIDIEIVKEINNYPAIIFPVNKNILDDIDTKDLKISYCKNCSHLYQMNIDDEFNQKLYTEYYKYYPYSSIECFVEHYRKPFEKIFAMFDIEKKKKKLLEIGVSSNKQLDFFNNFDYESFGITPQTTDLENNIISSFYEEYSFNFKFDVIVSRFNLEHIVDLDNFLFKIKNDLEDNGLFIVQVPNTEYFIKENILNFYAHEHIQYFTRKSISKLFEKNGFLIEHIHTFESPSVVIVGRKSLSKDIRINKYIESIEDITRNIMEKINNTIDTKVILYGASLSLTELLYCNSLSLIDNSKVLLVDDNPLVQNMVMPLYDNEIIPYNKNLIDINDIIVLVLNAVYHPKIVDKIRKDGLKNDIFLICESGLVKI